MKPLKKFCFLFPLKTGCKISSMILVYIQFISMPVKIYDVCCQTTFGVFLTIIRFFNMIDFVGCLALFAGAFVEKSGLVMVYLVTAALHVFVSTLFLFIYHLAVRVQADLIVSFVDIPVSIYCWFVALSYYHESKEEYNNLIISMNKI